MRFWIFLASFLYFWPGPGGVAWGATPAGEPEVVARAAVLADARTGQVLWARNPDLRMYPASTTKILTALVVVMRADLTERVRVVPEDTNAGGSAIWLQPGEVLSVEDLLYALLLNSANDAAEALARHVAGSDRDFARLLNDTALALGATNTHFTNPSGMPDPNHYTTARDLATIARAALAHPVLRRIVATRTYEIGRQDPEAVRYLVNHNKLLWRYPGAIGVKTGYTVEAGQCLVAAAQRGERTLIAVVLGSQGAAVWSDATVLLDYGFASFESRELVPAHLPVSRAPVRYGSRDLVAITADSFTYNFRAGEEPQVRQELRLDRHLKAPVAAGAKVGELVLFGRDTELGRVDLVAAQRVPRKAYTRWWFWVLLATGVVTVRRLVRRRGFRYRYRPRYRW